LKLGNAYERDGNLDEAIAEYRKAIELNSRNAVAHNNLGVLYKRKGLHADATREFQKAVEIEPSNAIGLRNLEDAKKGQLAVTERETQIAEALQNAEAQPQNPAAAYTLARLYAFHGRKGEAMTWLGKALNLGFVDIGYLKIDPALESLRDEPDYVWLLRGK
jgi:tetratricopeptide (TPR) repeat protein